MNKRTTEMSVTTREMQLVQLTIREMQFYAAHTQAKITYTLLGGFFGLMAALLLVACLPIAVNDKLIAILDRIVTALLPIVGTAVGFWMARQRERPQTFNDDGIVLPKGSDVQLHLSQTGTPPAQNAAGTDAPLVPPQEKQP